MQKKFIKIHKDPGIFTTEEAVRRLTEKRIMAVVMMVGRRKICLHIYFAYKRSAYKVYSG